MTTQTQGGEAPELIPIGGDPQAHARHRERVITWLEQRMGARSEAMATHRIEDARGRARARGALVSASRAGLWGLVAFYLVSASLVALMFTGRRDLSAETRDAIERSAASLAAPAAALTAAAAWARQRARRPLLVELRGPGPAGACDADAVLALAADRPRADAALFLVAADGFTREALAAAAGAGVRCFSSAGPEIVELRAAPDGEPTLPLPRSA